MITSTSLFLGQVNAQTKQENVNMQIFEATKYIANNKMKYSVFSNIIANCFKYDCST